VGGGAAAGRVRGGGSGSGSFARLLGERGEGLVGVRDGRGGGKGRRRGGECLLMTSTVLAGQASESGSFLTTSNILNMPWIEQALTLNW